MSRRNFDDWIEAYVDTLTPKGEAPARFHFWTAVSTIGACLRRRVYIDMGSFKYIPNFYIILVGPPGIVKKSTSIGIGAGMWHEVPGVYVGADVNTWQSFIEEVGKAEDMFADGDQTGVDLIDQKSTMTCTMSICISEFGSFFDPEDKQMVNMLTELFDGKSDIPFRKRTKTQGSDTIINPFINILAATTPQWMRDNFRGQFGGWGLSSRCIFLYADKRERSVAWPDEVWGKIIHTWKAPFIEDLNTIAQMQGAMTFAPEAREFWTPWYDAHGDRLTLLNRNPHHDPWLAYYLARKHDHVMKLTMVLAVSRGRMRASVTDLTDAIKHCDAIEDELSSVFKSYEQTNRVGKLNTDVADGILNGIRVAGGAIHERQLWAFTMSFMDKRGTESLIAQLVKVGYITPRQDEKGTLFYVLGEHAPNPATQETRH